MLASSRARSSPSSSVRTSPCARSSRGMALRAVRPRSARWRRVWCRPPASQWGTARGGRSRWRWPCPRALARMPAAPAQCHIHRDIGRGARHDDAWLARVVEDDALRAPHGAGSKAFAPIRPTSSPTVKSSSSGGCAPRAAKLLDGMQQDRDARAVVRAKVRRAIGAQDAVLQHRRMREARRHTVHMRVEQDRRLAVAFAGVAGPAREDCRRRPPAGRVRGVRRSRT